MYILLLIIILTSGWGAEGRRVAIVGSGVGASAAAFNLRKLLQNDVEIDVFERNDVPGGRTSSATIDGEIIELGASIAYQGNRYVLEMAGAAGLTTSPPPRSQSGLFALFDGEELVFRQSPWSFITLIKMLWHYGLAPWRYRSAAGAMATAFEKVYSLQDNGTYFETPVALLRAMGMYDLTQVNFKEYIVDEMGSYGSFASEFVTAAGLVNYNQNTLELNALAGLVSLLPATDPRLFRVDQGNEKLAARILQHVNATLNLNATVTQITKSPNGGFNLTVEGCSAGPWTTGRSNPGGGETKAGSCGAANVGVAFAVYDAVIIATPLENSRIEFEGINLPRIPRREYQQVVVTIVKGSVRPTFFGLDPGYMPYDSIMLTETGAGAVPFRSLSKVGSEKGHSGLYKLFSAQPLPHAWLSILFGARYDVMVNRTWQAYPKFDAPENFANFNLDEGLCYNNAWENGASAMETAAVAGRNCALLVSQSLKKSDGDNGRDPQFELTLGVTPPGGAAATAAVE